jgi:hypothetical protein
MFREAFGIKRVSASLLFLAIEIYLGFGRGIWDFDVGLTGSSLKQCDTRRTAKAVE